MKKLDLFDVPQISSVQEMILNSASTFEKRSALNDLNDTPLKNLTYGQLLDKILRFGAALQDIGINERAHIAIIGENRVQWALSFLTCMSFNYVAVPIDRNLKPNEILNILHESDAEAIIFSNSFAGLMAEDHQILKKMKHFICMDEIPPLNGFMSMNSLLINSRPIPLDKLPRINPEDIAEIIFTSGSLGRAKGVMLTQKNLASNLVDMVSMLFMYPEDRFLSVLPMHHTYECTCGLLCPLYCGSSIHYARSLKTVAEDIGNVKATMLLGVPLLFDKMFKKIRKNISADKKKAFLVPKLVKATNVLSGLGLKDIKKKIFAEMHEKFGGHVRIFIAGGAAPDPEVAKGLREFGFNFLQGYGLTETSPILALNRLDNFKDNAAGIPLPSVTIKINNPDETGSGEIYAKGPNIMKGYYKNQKMTDETFDGGWFKTGDMGFIDSDGFLHINGRKKNVIISKSGKNVFPEEIEDQLNRSEFILESLVYGEKDEKHDEIIAAQIVVDTEAFITYTESKGVQISESLVNDIIKTEIEKVNGQLAAFKQIKKWFIRQDEFEKTTTQKIKRYMVNKERIEADS